MKKPILLLLTILLAGLMHGQSLSSDSNKKNTKKQLTLTSANQNPLYIIVVDSTSIRIDDFTKYDIKPEWVESIDVLKDATSEKIYGNKNGVIMIYTKEEYWGKVLKEIEKVADSKP